MTFLTLARKNAWRKPLRTLLLTTCIAIAFLIYGLTAGFLAGAQGASSASEEILGVTSAAGRTFPLPLALGTRLAAEPDIAAMSHMARLRGFVGVETNVVAVSAVDLPSLMVVDGQSLALTPALLAAVAEGRDRVLVGRALAEAQGWSVGQSITVTAFDMPRQDGGRDWRFTIAGLFEGQSAQTDTYFILARYDAINAARARFKDTVDAFILRPATQAARDGDAGGTIGVGDLAARIDARFAGSATPTRTQSEKQFLEAFLRQYADVGLIVTLVVGTAFVTLMMIVVNTMVFAVRERRFEIGVLKTLGFSGRQIVALILFETLLVFALGSSAGLVLSGIGAEIAGPDLGLVLSSLVVAKALAIAAGLGLASGALPAFHALRMPVIKTFQAR